MLFVTEKMSALKSGKTIFEIAKNFRFETTQKSQSQKFYEFWFHNDLKSNKYDLNQKKIRF